MREKLSDILAGLPVSRRRRIEHRARELVADELSLGELRRLNGLTQAQLADRLGKGQDEVSRIEQRGDLLLSTLRAYVESIGGELELTCRFPGRPPVAIRAATTSNSLTRRKRAPARVRRHPGRS
jgi:hypothetical protein